MTTIKFSPSRITSHCLALIAICLASIVNNAESAVLMIESSFSAGSNQAFNGIAFRANAGTPYLYGADSNNSSFYTFDLTNQTQSWTSNVPAYTYGAAVGQGDFNPEFYVSATDIRTLRYDENSSAWYNTFFAPVEILGLESSNPYQNYSDFWAVEKAGQTNVVRLDYAGGQTIQQSIVNIGAGLTDLAVDLSGNLFILGGSTIYQYTTSGSFVTTFSVDPSIFNPTGIALDTSTGNIWVSNGTSTLYQLSAVPEPSAKMSVVIAGFLLTALYFNRRQKIKKTQRHN